MGIYIGLRGALKKGVKTAAEAAEAIGIGLQAFCIRGPLPTAERLVWVTETLEQCF